MNTDVPMVGKVYRVISGPYAGFEGKCVSCDLTNELPIILQAEDWVSAAVKVEEVEVVAINNPDIPRDQRN